MDEQNFFMKTGSVEILLYFRYLTPCQKFEKSLEPLQRSTSPWSSSDDEDKLRGRSHRTFSLRGPKYYKGVLCILTSSLRELMRSQGRLTFLTAYTTIAYKLSCLSIICKNSKNQANASQKKRSLFMTKNWPLLAHSRPKYFFNLLHLFDITPIYHYPQN